MTNHSSPPMTPASLQLLRLLCICCGEQEITEFLEDEELLRVKAFIGQGNSTSTKARAAAAAAAAAAGREEDEDEEGSEFPVPKQRLKGQTQKEQKV